MCGALQAQKGCLALRGDTIEGAGGYDRYPLSPRLTWLRWGTDGTE
jgi:hypothetical protein